MSGIYGSLQGGGGGGATSGSKVLLDTQTASASASLIFTSSIDNTTYQYYEFEFIQLKAASDNVTFRLECSINNGSSYLATNYWWAYNYLTSSGITGGTGSGGATTIINLFDSLGNSTGEGFFGNIKFYPSSSNTSVYQRFEHVMNTTAASSVLVQYRGTSYNTTSSDINAFRFTLSSGNITSGTIKLYGVLI